MKKFLPFLMILALLLSLTACGIAQSGSEPESTAQSLEESSAQAAPEQDNSWQFDSPENYQMDPEVFEALHQALPGSGIHTMVTVKDGVIIDEYYGGRLR